MTKEELIKALEGDKECENILVEYLKLIIGDFFDKYTKKYPLLEKEREYSLGEAGSYVLDVLKKYRYIWEEKDNYDIMARHMLLRYYFAR